METTAGKQTVRMGPVAKVMFALGAVAIVVTIAVNADTGGGTPGSCPAEQGRFDAAEQRGDTEGMRSAHARMGDAGCY